MSIEHYGRLKRLLDRNVPVRVELNLETEVTGKDVEGLNVLAELPGVDLARRHEVVMAAAHLDSWAAGTGATDDGAGVVIVMEAVRILRALDLTPRRTIRLALLDGGGAGGAGVQHGHAERSPPARAVNSVPDLRMNWFLSSAVGDGPHNGLSAGSERHVDRHRSDQRGQLAFGA